MAQQNLEAIFQRHDANEATLLEGRDVLQRQIIGYLPKATDDELYRYEDALRELTELGFGAQILERIKTYDSARAYRMSSVMSVLAENGQQTGVIEKLEEIRTVDDKGTYASYATVFDALAQFGQGDWVIRTVRSDNPEDLLHERLLSSLALGGFSQAVMEELQRVDLHELWKYDRAFSAVVEFGGENMEEAVIRRLHGIKPAERWDFGRTAASLLERKRGEELALLFTDVDLSGVAISDFPERNGLEYVRDSALFRLVEDYGQDEIIAHVLATVEPDLVWRYARTLLWLSEHGREQEVSQIMEASSAEALFDFLEDHVDYGVDFVHAGQAKVIVEKLGSLPTTKTKQRDNGVIWDEKKHQSVPRVIREEVFSQKYLASIVPIWAALVAEGEGQKVADIMAKVPFNKDQEWLKELLLAVIRNANRVNPTEC